MGGEKKNNVPRWGNICSLQNQQRVTSASLPTQRAQFTQLHWLHNYTGNKMQSKAVADFFFLSSLTVFTSKQRELDLESSRRWLEWPMLKKKQEFWTFSFSSMFKQNPMLPNTSRKSQNNYINGWQYWLLMLLSCVFAALIFLFTSEL